jgi:4'-phosphopantetheinyl transferase
MAAAFWLGAFSGGAPGRHAALLAFCAKELGVAPSLLTLAHDNFGAPALLIDGAHASWRISSSSRGNIALFALARDRIGVDLEFADGTAEPAWNVLHQEEKVAVRALPEASRPEAFLRLWTAKEAYLKALGLGLRREPGEISIRAQPAAFEIIDRGCAVDRLEARLWRERVGGRQVFCACAILPVLS